MSKLESGKSFWKRFHFNLSSIYREVLAVIEQMAAEQNIRIVWEKKKSHTAILLEVRDM